MELSARCNKRKWILGPSNPQNRMIIGAVMKADKKRFRITAVTAHSYQIHHLILFLANIDKA